MRTDLGLALLALEGTAPVRHLPLRLLQCRLQARRFLRPQQRRQRQRAVKCSQDRKFAGTSLKRLNARSLESESS